MDTKKFARRGMIIFLVVVALCMFFARTLQNLTTPKVRFNEATTGKLAKFYSLEAEVFFPESEAVYLDAARAYPIVINRVLVQKDAGVKEGDVLFKASVGEYDDKMNTLRESGQAKKVELAALDATNRKNPTETERNRRYQVLLSAMQTLSDKRVAMIAQGLGEASWQDEQKAYEEARDAFYETYLYSTLAVTDEVFDYIQKRDALITEINALEDKMIALKKVALAVGEIKAARDGVITAMDIKEGDTYAGAAPLYSMSAKDKPPVLRALSQTRFAEDTKATVKGDWDEQYTVVKAAGTNADGEKYVDFELNQAILDARGGLAAVIKAGKLKVTISNRASSTTTLINASCLRESDGQAYVYAAQYVDGGLLGGYYKVKKVSVTVVDRGDKQVSVTEDLSAYRLIDREDRTLKEDMRVMEQST